MIRKKTSIKVLMILGILFLSTFAFNNVVNASTGSKEEIEEVASNLTTNGIYVDLTVSEQIDKWADDPWRIDTSDIKGLSLPEGYSIGIVIFESGNLINNGTVTLFYNGKAVKTIHDIVPVKYKDTDKRVNSVDKDVESLKESIMEKLWDNEGNTTMIYKYTEDIKNTIPVSLIKKANQQLISDISKMSTMKNATFKMVGTPTDDGTDELYCIVGIFVDDVYYNSIVCMQKLVKVDAQEITEDTSKTITATDKDTKVKFEASKGVVPDDTVMEVKSIEDGTAYDKVKTIFKTAKTVWAFDITLKSNNVAVQPNGKVKISIPVNRYDDTSILTAYRIGEDGTKTEYKVNMVKEGLVWYASFEVDHFSTYALVENEKETTTTDATETTKTEENNTQKTTTKRELDSTPKTGEETNIVTVVSSILSLLSIMGIAIIKKI